MYSRNVITVNSENIFSSFTNVILITGNNALGLKYGYSFTTI